MRAAERGLFERGFFWVKKGTFWGWGNLMGGGRWNGKTMER